MTTTLATLTVDGTEVATYVDGAAVDDPTLSPRPFLHPVRTLDGLVVTDCMPDDHRWHLGLSVAIQDVGGVNLWGGRTYVRDQGYTWRDDHGVQRHLGWEQRTPTGFDEQLAWLAPDGRQLLHEHRSVRASEAVLAPSANMTASAEPTPHREAGRGRVEGHRRGPRHGRHPPGARTTRDAWELGFGFELSNVTGEPLALGSPATNGRVGAGYGGLFWRLSPAASSRVFTGDGVGEDAVHGAVTPWVAWVADGVDGQGGAATFTVVLAHDDPPHTGADDPWFVRTEMYPGMCSALAFERPTLLAPGGVLRRRVRALVADAVLTESDVASWFGSRS